MTYMQDSKWYFEKGLEQEKKGNLRQAFFSYAQSNFYEQSRGGNSSEITEYFERFQEKYPDRCQPIPIIILTYNAKNYTEICFQSIEKFCAPEAYQIYVIDNLSKDGTREWLKEQKNLTVVYNEENRGFAGGCNQGAMLAKKCMGEQIKNTAYFFLNNDTILMKDSLYNLALSLYEDSKTVAVGPICNFDFEEESDNLEDYFCFADRNNEYSLMQKQKVQKLVGFALLVKADAFHEINGFDEGFGIGNYEDDDLCLRLIEKGHELLFCKDAFLYHFGHRSFEALKERENISLDDLLNTNRERFQDKWGFSTREIGGDKEEFVDYLDPAAEGNLLQYPCATGNVLLKVSEKCKKLKLFGIEDNESSARIASKHFTVIGKSVFEIADEFFGQKFKYILLTNDLSTYPDLEKMLKRLTSLLAEDGEIIFYFKNKEYVPFQRKMKERFNSSYFYTLDEMEALLQRNGIEFTDAYGHRETLSGGSLEYLEQMGLKSEKIPESYLVSWYLGCGKAPLLR